MPTKEELDNHANQLNPNHPEYWRSRNLPVPPTVGNTSIPKKNREGNAPLADDDNDVDGYPSGWDH